MLPVGHVCYNSSLRSRKPTFHLGYHVLTVHHTDRPNFTPIQVNYPVASIEHAEFLVGRVIHRRKTAAEVGQSIGLVPKRARAFRKFSMDMCGRLMLEVKPKYVF